jgi:hypothetical protein
MGDKHGTYIGSGADVITTGDGDDNFKGLGGNDLFNAGGGFDIAYFSGGRLDYDITISEDGRTTTVRDLNAADGDEGTDTLVDVERLVFNHSGALTELPVEDPYASRAIGEVHRITANSSWQSISFDRAYLDPMVFAFVTTTNDADPVVTRLRNVDGVSASLRLQETRRLLGEGRDGTHADEEVTLLVLEKGVHQLADGTVLQVGSTVTNKLYVKGFEDITFDDAFDAAPTLLTQVQSFAGSDWVASRVRGTDATGFELTMQEEEYDNVNHAWEEVGWLAIDKGAGAEGGLTWHAGSSTKTVNGNLRTVSYGEAFDTAPLLLASIATYAGSDPVIARTGVVGTSSFTVKAQEETSKDAETYHGYESVDWLAFSGEGTLTGGPVVHKVMESGLAVVNDQDLRITFASDFDNPVVVATVTQRDGGEQVVARISDVGQSGFTLRLQEPDALDGLHGYEDVSWVVVEAGAWIVNGMMVEAGLTVTDQVIRYGSERASFSVGFNATPTVIAQVQSDEDPAFVYARVMNGDADGFDFALEEETASSWSAHGQEGFGWIAIEQGAAFAEGDGQLLIEAGSIKANHNFVEQRFNAAVETAILLATMSTHSYPAPASARMQGLDQAGFDIRVEEDKSVFGDPSHGHERFDWMVINGEGELWGYSVA